MPQSNLQAKLEALLFVYGEPVKLKTLSEKLEVSQNETEAALMNLRSELQNENRGLAIFSSDDKYSLITKPELSKIVQKVVKEEFDSELTAASLETLAIISYMGPCSRAEIDYIRGVNSSFILRNLSIRGLVDRKQDPDRSNAFIYNVSFDFLKHMGVESVDSLPEHDKYRELVKSFLKKENEVPQAQL